MTTRETSATASAEPRGMIGARTAIKASSRAPTPPGAGTIRTPADQASA
jgi:hypothetical protein